MHGGWSSPAILLLSSNESPLPDGKITQDEATWLTTLFVFGGAIGNVANVYTTNRFGRKTLLQFNAVPVIVRIIIIDHS